MKTIALGLLFAAAFLTLGFITGNRPESVPAPGRRVHADPADPAVLSQVARAQAAAILSPAPDAARLLLSGF